MKPEKRLTGLLNVNPGATVVLVDAKGTKHPLGNVDITYDGKQIALYQDGHPEPGAFLASGPEEVR